MLLHYKQQQKHVWGASGVVPFMLEPETYTTGLFLLQLVYFQLIKTHLHQPWDIWDSVDILLYVSPIGSVADPDPKDPHNFRSKTSFVI